MVTAFTHTHTRPRIYVFFLFFSLSLALPLFQTKIDQQFRYVIERTFSFFLLFFFALMHARMSPLMAINRGMVRLQWD